MGRRSEIFHLNKLAAGQTHLGAAIGTNTSGFLCLRERINNTQDKEEKQRRKCVPNRSGMPEENLAMTASLPADASTYQTITKGVGITNPYVQRYLDVGRSPVITVSEEQMGIFHGRNTGRYARPPQLFDCHEGLV